MILLGCPIVLSAPDWSATHTLVKNWTFDDGDINSTTRGGSNNWNLQTTAGVQDNYLKYTGSTTTQYGYLYSTDPSYLTNDNDTWIIQGWVNNKLATDHSWLGIMIANDTDKQDTVGVSMHGGNYYHHNWTVRATTEVLSIYSAPNQCNGTAETWRYIQINITKGLAYIQVYTDSTLQNVVCNNGVQRVFTKNMSQTYKQGYLGFGSVSSAGFDNIEFWKLGSGAPANNPPVVSSPLKLPSNASVNTIFLTGVNVTSNISDTDLNASKILASLKVNATSVYINGTLQTMNKTSPYGLNISGSYTWYFDESDLIGGTYNLPQELMENTTHEYRILNPTNAWLKVKFFNVTNSIQQNFVEIMDANDTTVVSTSEYYYCNGNYTTGNPTNDPHCTLFYSAANNASFNHEHIQGNSKHKTFSLAINTETGTLNGVYVTKESYILKRGTTSGDRYYFINRTTRNDQVQITSNAGSTYSNLSTITPDWHIHQVSNTSGFDIRICASDNADQQTCSAWVSDIPEFPTLPPNAVMITSPIEGGEYNNSLLINHTFSLSPSGYNISNYTYYYQLNGTTTLSLIGSNNKNTNSLTWDISGLADGYYFIMVRAYDINGLYTDAYSGYFLIDNPLTEIAALENIASSIDNLSEVVNMLPLILIYGVITYLAFYLMKTGNVWIGMAFNFGSFGFDLFFVQWIYDTYIDGFIVNTWQGIFIWIFGMMLYVFAVGKLASIFFVKVPSKVKT